MPRPIYQSNIKQSTGRFFTTEQDSFLGGQLTAMIDSFKSLLCGNENVTIKQIEGACSTNEPIHFIADIGDPDFPIEEEYYENGFGQKVLKYRVVKPRMKIQFTCDTLIRQRIYKMIAENEYWLMDFETTWKNVQVSMMQVDFDNELADEMGNMWEMQLSFEVANASNLATFGTFPCCGDAVYSEYPYSDDCPPDPPDPEACENMTVSLTRTDDEVSLTVTDPIAGYQSQWSFTPIGGGATINLGTNLTSANFPAYGTIRVRVWAGVCVKETSSTYTNPCTGFNVSITNSGGVLIANVDAAHTPADSYSWEYSEDGTTWEALGSFDEQIASEGAGLYRVTVESGECELTRTINVDAQNLCQYEGEITKDGNVLTFVPDSEDYDITGYEWLVDIGDGNGLVPIVGETTDTITATESGLYQVNVTFEDGCVVSYTIVHIMCADCAQFDVDIEQDGNTLTADVSGCANPIYEWIKITSDGTKEVISTTDSAELDDYGNYFLIVCCDDCEPKSYLIAYSIDGILVIDTIIGTNKIAWGGL